ncbi:MAG: 4Fe-4S binding protein [Phycisphaeraceae bacterium]
MKTTPRLRPPVRRWNLARLRPWVQTGFLALWLDPLLLRWHSMPGCVFHCYACPLAAVACPIGLLAQFSALHIVPLATLGVLVAVGALVGTAVCGWACPFGFMQDLLARLPTRKLELPAWMGVGRYVTLLALVLTVPFLFGAEHWLFFCNVCPAGALEGALGQSIYRGQLFLPNAIKLSVTALVLGLALFARRPWCRVLCPLGGIFALFNRVSLLYLRFNAPHCTECNLCRSRCNYGVKVDQSINNTSCVRCLECTSCAAITLTIAGAGPKQQ